MLDGEIGTAKKPDMRFGKASAAFLVIASILMLIKYCLYPNGALLENPRIGYLGLIMIPCSLISAIVGIFCDLKKRLAIIITAMIGGSIIIYIIVVVTAGIYFMDQILTHIGERIN